MAFIKLFPHDDEPWFTVEVVVNRLREECQYFKADSEEGRDHISGMMAAMLKLPRDLPGWQEELDELAAGQDQAVMVEFGDSPEEFARTCVAPEKELFFGRRDEIDGRARPFIERAARVLGYELFGG